MFGIKINGLPMAPATVSRLVAKFSKKANVIVDEQGRRFASCHDSWRRFANRWATRVVPALLQQLKRHESIETMMKHYVEIESESIQQVLSS